MKSIYKLLLLIILIIPSNAGADHSYFKNVKNKLIKDGFDKATIEKIYSPKQINFQFNSVALFFTVSEYKLDYAGFLTKDNAAKAKKYIKKYNNSFNSAYHKYGVPPQVIASILSVETRLGTFRGNQKVLAVLSSIAAMEDNHVKKMVKKSILSRKNRYSGSIFRKRAHSKSLWAYEELKKFVKYALNNKLDPAIITGSYAGAIGIPQFMPSNIAIYGADGNNDGIIDLHTHEDAIASVARYLKKHGWTKNPKKDKALSVILKYNKSIPYAETVLKLSEMIGDK